MAVIPESVEQFLARLRATIAEDVEIARDLDAIADGTFEPAPEPESGGF